MATRHEAQRTRGNARALVAPLSAVALWAAACGSQPIPLVAVAGTSVTLAIPNTFTTGFGRTLSGALTPFSPTIPSVPYDPASPLEDVQRGEMLFALYEGATFVTYLPSRYITRVQPDEASELAIGTGSIGIANGQTLAVLDIPSAVTAGSYNIRVERWLRSETAPHDFAFQPETISGTAWVGWGTNDPEAGIPLDIVAGTVDRFTGKTGWDDFFGNFVSVNVNDELNGLVPHPKAALFVFENGTTVSPAAWEFEVDYPTEKIDVRGVELIRKTQQGTLLSFVPDPGPPGTCASPSTGRFKVRAVDPERKVLAVRVVYQLLNFDSCGGRVVPGDLALVAGSLNAWDLDGNPMNAVFDQALSDANLSF